MVSIPCSQTRHVIYCDPNDRREHGPKSKYQQNTKSVLKDAENRGYFTSLTVKYLHEKFNGDCDQAKLSEYEIRDKMKLIRAINLRNENIQRLDCLNYCRNLVYINLSKNYISDFGSLRYCHALLCLDLSSNLIEILPDFTFWSNMFCLKFLYLHDNPIASPDSIVGLCGCQTISVITLFDTPLSLKRKYRHFVVNTIWSLKILDRHFVSDEEIIEIADFGTSYFRSMDRSLKISSYCSYEDRNTSEIEHDLKQFLILINRLAAHLSPVLIIQRWIRGFLSRRKGSKGRMAIKGSVSPIVPNVVNSPSSIPIVEAISRQKETQSLVIDLAHLNKISTLENLDREADLRNYFTYRSPSKLGYDNNSQGQISREPDKRERLEHDPESSYVLESPNLFKLQINKAPTTSKSPSTELMIEKRSYHQFVRESDKIYHDKTICQLPEIKSRPVKKNNSETLFRKTQGSMGLFLLNKWDKVDREIEEMERMHNRINFVQIIRNERDLNQIKVDEDRMKKLALIKLQHKDHQDQVNKAKELEEKNLKKTADELRVKNHRGKERKNKISNQIAFSLDFRSKQSAACKAINVFEQMTRKDEQLQTNKCTVSELKESLQLEMDSVKAYLESQAVNRRMEKRIENSALDIQLLQQANQRMNESKKRVEKLKSIRRLVSCPQIPIIQLNVDST